MSVHRESDDDSGLQDGENDAHSGRTCSAPSCWRDGHPVRVRGETERDAILCDEHEDLYLPIA
jgi:hypothetical protein